MKQTDISHSAESCSSDKLHESEASLETSGDLNEEEETNSNTRSNSTCQICSESYKQAMISVNCWHVHCRNCWLRSLSNEKFCK